MERWVGKVALVTGASAGIGAATVQSLSEKGIIVVALARREDKLKEVAASCKEKVYTRVCDLSKEQEIVDTFAWIEKTVGGVDILINNAGVIKASTLTGGDSADWKAMWETNVLALSITTREAIKSMRLRGDNGHIVHINSAAGHMVPAISNMAMYSASKFAVTSLTESLRLELVKLGSSIKVTSISPGTVVTDMVRNFRVEKNKAAPGAPKTGGILAALEVGDITDAIIYCLGTRPIVQVHEIQIQATGQKYTD